jgi:hypothetical protein
VGEGFVGWYVCEWCNVLVGVGVSCMGWCGMHVFSQ